MAHPIITWSGEGMGGGKVSLKIRSSSLGVYILVKKIYIYISLKSIQAWSLDNTEPDLKGMSLWISEELSQT